MEMKTGERTCMSRTVWSEKRILLFFLDFILQNSQANERGELALHLAHCRYLIGSLILSVYSWNVYISGMAVWKFWGSCKFLLLFCLELNMKFPERQWCFREEALAKPPTGKCGKSSHHWRRLPSSGENTPSWFTASWEVLCVSGRRTCREKA